MCFNAYFALYREGVGESLLPSPQIAHDGSLFTGWVSTVSSGKSFGDPIGCPLLKQSRFHEAFFFFRMMGFLTLRITQNRQHALYSVATR